MDFLPKDINEYVEAHTSPETALLKKLDRETNANVMMPRMISGHFQGRFLSFFMKCLKPKNVLEIGTFTGYSGLCLAEGLAEGGKLFTLDVNEELEDMVRRYIAEAGIEDKVEYLLGNALDIIPTLDVEFDAVFIDADKKNYSQYYDLIFDKIRPGGGIMADNVLWRGKIVPSGRKKLDSKTKELLDFNAKVQADPRVENILMPIRDGIMMALKK